MSIDAHDQRVLIVEDNPDLQFGLSLGFKNAGYQVQTAATISEATLKLRRVAPDAVILDLMLPDGDGLELLTKIRQSPLDCVVIIVTARDAEADRLAGFRLGADDYVVKPFSVLELIERVKARVSGRVDSARVIRLGDTVLDLQQQVILARGRRISITRQESRVLQVLWNRRGRPVSRRELLYEAWGYVTGAKTRTLDHAVANLRRKLEHDPEHPRWIITVRGVGYQLNPPSMAGSPSQ